MIKHDPESQVCHASLPSVCLSLRERSWTIWRESLLFSLSLQRVWSTATDKAARPDSKWLPHYLIHQHQLTLCQGVWSSAPSKCSRRREQSVERFQRKNWLFCTLNQMMHLFIKHSHRWKNMTDPLNCVKQS